MPPTSLPEEAPSGGLPTAASESTRSPESPRAASNDIPLGVAVTSEPGKAGTVTARKAGGLRDMGLEVDPRKVGVKAALQHLAKAVNIAFQTDYGENYLESVYQAAIVRRGEVIIVHKEYFGFGDSWFGQFGRLIRSLELTLEGPDPASPEGQQRIAEKGPSTIRGILNLIGRKLDLVAEYEDRVPAYVEQTFDRLEASGIIVGWNRHDWDIWTTSIGLDIRIAPKAEEEAEPQQPVAEATPSDTAEALSQTNQP
jgi:hypothetical protein